MKENQQSYRPYCTSSSAPKYWAGVHVTELDGTEMLQECCGKYLDHTGTRETHDIE
jgi:hypothetical protein